MGTMMAIATARRAAHRRAAPTSVRTCTRGIGRTAGAVTSVCVDTVSATTERHGAIGVTPHDESQIEERNDERHEEEDDGDGAPVAHLRALDAAIHEVDGHRVRGV